MCQILTVCHAAGMCWQPNTWSGLLFKRFRAAQNFCRAVSLAQQEAVFVIFFNTYFTQGNYLISLFLQHTLSLPAQSRTEFKEQETTHLILLSEIKLVPMWQYCLYKYHMANAGFFIVKKCFCLIQYTSDMNQIFSENPRVHCSLFQIY